DQLHGVLPEEAVRSAGRGGFRWGQNGLMTICDKLGRIGAGYYRDGRDDEDTECPNNSACWTTNVLRSSRPASSSCGKAAARAVCSCSSFRRIRSSSSCQSALVRVT